MSLPAHHPFRSAEAKARYRALYAQREARWPVPWEPRTVETSHGSTFVRVCGPVDGPPLVLLHGAATSGLMWEYNIRAFAARHRAYVIDSVYDYGRSVYARPVKTVGEFAAWLDEVFAGLGLDEARFVGISYGAWIGARFLMDFPRRVTRAVLVAPAAGVARLRLRWILFALAVPLAGWIARAFYDWMMGDAMRAGEEGRRAVDELRADTLVANQCYQPKMGPVPSRYADAELRSIRPPTAVVMGANEKLYDPFKARDRLARVAPQIQTMILPRCGHDLIVAQRELFETTVLEFLAEP